jgi:dihydroorotase
MVMRDIALARLTGAKVHFQHMSTAGSVAMIAAARAAGMSVTSEAAPHHFTLTDECCAGYDATFKVHPPLRADGDVAAIKAGLADGTLDAIATDHAPHAPEEKERPFDHAPPGMLGLEYALALAFTQLVDGGTGMTDADVLAALSWRPAAIAGLAEHGNAVAAGAAANLCVIDTRHTWTIDASGGASRSRNVPYVGRTVRGKVRHTVLQGEPVVVDGQAQR